MADTEEGVAQAEDATPRLAVRASLAGLEHQHAAWVGRLAGLEYVELMLVRLYDADRKAPGAIISLARLGDDLKRKSL